MLAQLYPCLTGYRLWVTYVIDVSLRWLDVFFQRVATNKVKHAYINRLSGCQKFNWGFHEQDSIVLLLDQVWGVRDETYTRDPRNKFLSPQNKTDEYSSAVRHKLGGNFEKKIPTL